MLPLHDQLALAHAVFACIAVLFTLPIALLAGRYLRNPGPVWFRIHFLFTSMTVFLIVLVFGLGMGAVATADEGTQFNGPDSDLHHKVGLAVYIIVLLQGMLGVAAHWTKSGHALRRLHVPFGIIVAAGLYWETWEGMHNEWPEMSIILTTTPSSVQILFWVLFLLSVSAYLSAAGQATLKLLANRAGVAASSRDTSVDEKFGK